MPQSVEPHPVIQAIDLGKSYAAGQFAIRHVDLSVGTGDFVAVIGRSGAGKSTLLRCLNLLVRPTEGRVELSSGGAGGGGACVDITHASGRRLRDVRGRVGMIFQGFNLVRRLSVLDNVLCGRLRFRRGVTGVMMSTLRWLPRSEREVAFECLRKVGIEHLAFRRADSLSGGQQQRVAIARLLAQESEVILADEPIASLDPQSADTVMKTLREIYETRRIPVIVNLHQVEIARSFATRIVGMAGGRIHVDCPADRLTGGDIDEIYQNAPGRGAGEGDSEAETASAVIARRRGAGGASAGAGVYPASDERLGVPQGVQA